MSPQSILSKSKCPPKQQIAAIFLNSLTLHARCGCWLSFRSEECILNVCVFWSDDSMESFDSERRPHFPQFSYSASGTAWSFPKIPDLTETAQLLWDQTFTLPRLPRLDLWCLSVSRCFCGLWFQEDTRGNTNISTQTAKLRTSLIDSCIKTNVMPNITVFTFTDQLKRAKPTAAFTLYEYLEYNSAIFVISHMIISRLKRVSTPKVFLD